MRITDLPTDVINEISTFPFCICRDSLKKTCKTFYHDAHIIGYTDSAFEYDLQLFLRNGEQMRYAWKNSIHFITPHRTTKMFNGLYEFYPFITHDLWFCSFQSTYTLCAGTYLFYFHSNIFLKNITLQAHGGQTEHINQCNTVSASSCGNCMIRFTLHKTTTMEFSCDEHNSYKHRKWIYFAMCIPEYYYKKCVSLFCRELTPKPLATISSRIFV